MTDQPLANFQYEIYLGGLGGALPAHPVDIAALEAEARTLLTDGAYGYVAGGAGTEDTMRANLDAFKRWRIVPRMLRDIGVRRLETSVLGTPMPAPVLLAPIGVQSIVHADAEVATAAGAAAAGVPIVLSTASSKPMEEVAAAMGDVPRWFQLYWPSDRELAQSFLRRAEAAGFSAVVVTLDTWLLAWRPRDLQNAYLPFLRGEGIANYLTDPVFRSRLAKPPEEDMQSAVGRFLSVFSDPTVTWDDLAFLRSSTSLPIVLKGILHPRDARRAADAGMDAIVVSNHGGRQVDGAIATLDALPRVVEAVPQMPVLLDSGIRCAADAFKALALGARAVFLGRPYMWGLACAGAAGVTAVTRGFLAELDLTLALAGYTSFADVGPDALELLP
jgi:isopentenyl diphosphate isomerase/L-lactate dehydrogenase-like FMN-dependent dehydrogenase